MDMGCNGRVVMLHGKLGVGEVGDGCGVATRPVNSIVSDEGVAPFALVGGRLMCSEVRAATLSKGVCPL